MADLRKIVTVASSKGGIKALKILLSLLPENLDAPVFLIQHLSPGYKTFLHYHLNRFSKLKVTLAEEGMEVLNRIIYNKPYY